MQRPALNTPILALARMHKLARREGTVLLVIAGSFAMLSAIAKDAPGALAGVAASGTAVLELHGATLLAACRRSNRRFLVASQLTLLATVLVYCAWRTTHPDLERIQPFLTTDMKASIAQLGLTVNQFLLLTNRLTYALVAAVTLLYQGGMACHYYFKQRAFANVLTRD